MRRLKIMAGAGTALLLGVLAACGTDSSGEATDEQGDDSVVAEAEQVDSVHDMLPAEIESSGKLTIATDPNYPPFEYYDDDNKTIIGLDIDMGTALGRVMGVETEFTPVAFDGIIPGISAGKYQAAMSFLGDIKERQATVDFVDYLQDTTSLMVKSGNSDGLAIDDLCGKVIAVQKGSTQDTKIVPELSEECTASGEEEIVINSYPDQNQANVAVTSGRVDGSLLVTSVIGRVVEASNGQLEQVPGEGIYPKKYGIVVPKGSELAPVLQAALVELEEQGVYAKILDEWKQSAGAIHDFTINDPDAE